MLAQYYHPPWMSIRSLAWDYLPDMAQGEIGHEFCLFSLLSKNGPLKKTFCADNISITDAYVKLWNGPDHPSDIGHQ